MRRPPLSAVALMLALAVPAGASSFHADVERAVLRRDPGRLEEARSVLGTLTSTASGAYMRPYDAALVYMGLNDHDAALEQLEKAFGEGGNWLNYLQLDPAFVALRDHPRFSALLRRVAEGTAATRRS